MNFLVHLIYLSPLLAGVGIILGLPARRTAVTASVIAIVAAVIVFLGYDRVAGGYQFTGFVPLVADWDLNLSAGVDGLSATLLLLTSIVALAAVWLAPKVDEGEHRYYACILLIAAGAAGAFASLDLFFFYAFHELALIPTFLMIGIWGSGNRQGAAWKITIYLSIGSIILLIGLIGLYLLPSPEQRTFNIVKLQQLASTGALFRPGIQFHLFSVIVRIWHSRIALSVSYLGAASLCVRAGTGDHASCWRFEEVRPLRPSQGGSATDAGSGAPLGMAALDPARRQHPLRRSCHDFPEATRPHPRLFERYAHGIYISRDRQL